MKRIWLLIVASLALGIGGLTQALPASAESQRTTGNAKLIPGSGSKPVDPKDPEGTGKPFPGDSKDPNNKGTGSTGLLTLDYISNLKFTQDQTVNGVIDATATNRKAFVQVSDRRATGTGWNLMLKPEPLVGKSDSSVSISAATLTLGNAYFLSSGGNVSQAPTVTTGATEALPVGSYSLVAQAQNRPGNRQGVGTWLLRLNTSNSEPTRLSVLAAAVTKQQTYEGDLSWLLTDTPQ